MFTWQESGILKYLQLEEMVTEGIKAVFTSRQGGISTGDYAALNLGLHTGDDYSNILENRKRIASVLQINAKDFVAAEQVHGNNIYLVKQKDKGKGSREYKNSISNADSLITNIRGLPLISFYADCVPLLICDPVKRVVALAHAGWKGTVLSIGPKTIMKMEQLFGTNPKDCIVGIGPSISQSNYEVDEYMLNVFRDKFNFWSQIFIDKGNGHYNLDLKKANLLSLKKAGLLRENIIISDLCTYDCEELFYSYRRDKGQTGRMASIIML